jgi:hypothetical protein
VRPAAERPVSGRRCREPAPQVSSSVVEGVAAEVAHRGPERTRDAVADQTVEERDLVVADPARLLKQPVVDPATRVLVGAEGQAVAVVAVAEVVQRARAEEVVVEVTEDGDRAGRVAATVGAPVKRRLVLRQRVEGLLIQSHDLVGPFDRRVRGRRRVRQRAGRLL